MKEAALAYHKEPQPGKLATAITKPCHTAEELSLAYSPGVAYPCLEIKSNPETVFDYTGKGNLVGVISNGTAVLGLGDIGPSAGKPVMEGKGVLFKRFANINVFDIEIAEKDPNKMIEIIAALEPTFGGINLEDIKAPECFQIEEALIKRLNIPVFHDDQHGTAIVTLAGLTNALHIAGKKIDAVKIVFSGAGAAAIAIAKLLSDVGVPKPHIWMYDTSGLLSKNRTDLNPYKQLFAEHTRDASLAEALQGADVFIGVSAANILTQEMVAGMNATPIIFALANPNPEILPSDATAAKPDAIVATGRSDFANQVNNVLGFPYIFRGALDVRAKEINLQMKLAAAEAIASLAHEPVPQTVVDAYGMNFVFGPNYIIPKPFDPRLLSRVASAVAKAAVDSGVARTPISDLDAYRQRLEDMMQTKQ